MSHWRSHFNPGDEQARRTTKARAALATRASIMDWLSCAGIWLASGNVEKNRFVLSKIV